MRFFPTLCFLPYYAFLQLIFIKNVIIRQENKMNLKKCYFAKSKKTKMKMRSIKTEKPLAEYKTVTNKNS